MMIKLQKGDYVATADIKDEAEYHAIARAFMDAGCEAGEYPALGNIYPIMGWRGHLNKLFHGFNNSGWARRQLTPAQILATPQWVPEVGEPVLIDKVEKGKVLAVSETTRQGHRAWVEMEDGDMRMPSVCVLSPLPSEEDRAVEELENVLRQLPIATATFKDTARTLYQHGYRKQPQPAEDIDFNDPANWRAGDLVEYHGGERPLPWYTVGKVYTLEGSDGKLGVIDDDGEFVCQGVKKKRFRFVRRT